MRLIADDPRCCWLLPSFVLGPLVMTALMLYQLPLAAERGWG